MRHELQQNISYGSAENTTVERTTAWMTYQKVKFPPLKTYQLLKPNTGGKIDSHNVAGREDET